MINKYLIVTTNPVVKGAVCVFCLDVDLTLPFFIVIGHLEGIVRSLVIGIVLIVLEHVIVIIVFRQIGSPWELRGGGVAWEVGVEGASAVGGRPTGVGAASPSRGGRSRGCTRGTALGTSAGLSPRVEVFPSLEPGDDFANQSKVTTQHLCF